MPLRIAISFEKYQALHHRAGHSDKLLAMADITKLANTLIRQFEFGDPGDPIQPELDQLLLNRLNLTKTRVFTYKDHLMRAVEHSKILLQLVGG